MLKVKRRPKTVYCEVLDIVYTDHPKKFILKTKFEPIVPTYTGQIVVAFYYPRSHKVMEVLFKQKFDVVAGHEFTLDGELTVTVGEV